MQDAALKQCTARIEQQLGWGNSAGWTSQEYEDLSLRIQEKTSRVISATTLKRLWGRVDYRSRPSRHSLDTLAAFLDYPSWRAFTESLEPEAVPDRHPPEVERARPEVAVSPLRLPRRIPHGILALFALPVLLIGGFVAWTGLNGSPDETWPIDPSGVLFRSRPVAQGIPNTVIFEYDVRGVEADSFFIQQSWDPRRRSQVSPDNQTFTSIYYLPGFFNAKLIADTTILKQHPVHVTTDGWLALVEKYPIPIYLQDGLEQNKGYLSVSSSWLREQGIDNGSDHQVLGFYNVRMFDSLHTDRFSLEATLRQDLDDGRYACKHVRIAIDAEKNALMIPLSIPGCVGDMGIMLGNTFLHGSTNDLSALGTDLSTWQRLHVEVKDRNVRIQVGSNPPFNARFTEDIGYIAGLSFHFEGTGAVDYVALKDEHGETVYEETF
jgi:hypothetical protein